MSDDSQQKSSPLMFVFALGVAALAGAVGTYIAMDLSGKGAASSDTFTSEAAQSVAPPNAAAIAAAQSEMVKLYESVNDQFVYQLRQYGTRLEAIADVADAEGATTAATQMRELGKETDDLIARYDKIAKQ